VVAFIHGFVSMELSGASRLVGDVAHAFAIDSIVAGLYAKARDEPPTDAVNVGRRGLILVSGFASQRAHQKRSGPDRG
jgi:hypothetical protein